LNEEEEMSLSGQRKNELDALCLRLRRDLIRVLHGIQTGHPGGSLSMTEILVTLYFEKLRIDPARPGDPGRDRFILSKGHGAPMLYEVLAERGFFPREDLGSLRQIGSHLQGHPCARKTPGIELSTGPLGLGLSAGLGMALAARLDGRDYRTYVLMGDGELQEGIVWEGAMSAARFAADRLCVIVDYNGVQLDGTLDEVMPLGDLSAKWRAFGWQVIEVDDGHDLTQLSDAIDQAATTKGRPVVILARTVKGKGVSFMEGESAWHGKPIGDDDYAKAMKELGVEA
jgi:transketolase